MRKLLQMLLDDEEPEAYNYAMLDLAALVCTPDKPNCPACPLLPYCVTGQQQAICRTD
jgi:A/G-specific adenine glycosylase